jgi:hypothetical protein
VFIVVEGWNFHIEQLLVKFSFFGYMPNMAKKWQISHFSPQCIYIAPGTCIFKIFRKEQHAAIAE